MLIDKDNKPNWNPDQVEDVDPQHVEGFFAPLASDHPTGELSLQTN